MENLSDMIVEVSCGYRNKYFRYFTKMKTVSVTECLKRNRWFGRKKKKSLAAKGSQDVRW